MSSTKGRRFLQNKSTLLSTKVLCASGFIRNGCFFTCYSSDSTTVQVVMFSLELKLWSAICSELKIYDRTMTTRPIRRPVNVPSLQKKIAQFIKSNMSLLCEIASCIAIVMSSHWCLPCFASMSRIWNLLNKIIFIQFKPGYMNAKLNKNIHIT